MARCKGYGAFDHIISVEVTVSVIVKGEEITQTHIERDYDDETTAACAIARGKLEHILGSSKSVVDFETDACEIVEMVRRP